MQWFCDAPKPLILYEPGGKKAFHCFDICMLSLNREGGQISQLKSQSCCWQSEIIPVYIIQAFTFKSKLSRIIMQDTLEPTWYTKAFYDDWCG